MRAPIPDAEGCPTLLAAVTFRESSWQERAIGSRGEVGLFQVHGLALGGMTPTMALDPRTNVQLGTQWLDYASRVCARWKDKPEHAERALSAYAGLGCVTSRTARLALRYAREMRR
jgi:membrane-bound lytic murein transglycosylase MltF